MNDLPITVDSNTFYTIRTGDLLFIVKTELNQIQLPFYLPCTPLTLPLYTNWIQQNELDEAQTNVCLRASETKGKQAK